MSDSMKDELAVVTAKIDSIFATHDTQIAASVMYGHSARAIRSLIAAGLWSKESVKAMMDEIQASVLTPQTEKPEVQYIMDGEVCGRSN